MEPFARRQPSDNLEELQGQLLRELATLQDRRGEEPELFRAYVQHALVLAWRGVADGRMRAPREALDCLRAAQPFIDHFMPDFADPAAAAAAEIYFLAQNLFLATQALEERRVADRISDPRSETERAILKVLAESRGTFLRRGEIHERLSPSARPTPPRVGQILVELHGENLVLRIHGRAQGNPNAAFYALSPWGLELCRSLGLIDDKAASPPQASPPLLDQALSTLVDKNVPFEWRSILAGLVGNLEPTPEIQNRLRYWAGRSETDEITDRLVATIFAGWKHADRPAGNPEMLQVINTAVEAYQTWGRHNKAA